MNYSPISTISLWIVIGMGFIGIVILAIITGVVLGTYLRERYR